MAEAMFPKPIKAILAFSRVSMVIVLAESVNAFKYTEATLLGTN